MWEGLKLVAYVRVSEESESPENQEYAIYKWCSQTGHIIVDTYRDIGISGALAPTERPGFKQALAKLEEADGLVVYALDRIARSLTELFEIVKTIEAKGKVVISVREEWLQNIDPRVRGIIIAMLGWAAEIERAFISERTKLALARLKAQGKRIGRPKKATDQTIKEALRYLSHGYSLKATSKILGVGYTTLAGAILTNPTWRAEYYNIKSRLKAKKKPSSRA